MKTVARHLYDYVDDQQGCTHTTKNGIIISAPDYDWLQAEFTWVNGEDGNVTVSFYSEMKRFTKTLGLKSLQDIDAITPGRLMELYYDGLAEMVCFVYLNCIYCISFQKHGEFIIAENERGHKHFIPLIDKLETPEQFIAYARHYYQLMECNEN